ncbi:MAG: hypothetical protein HYR72_23310 [Deltaproteobacteria bacterium]|nr:hypothetical protein [Deltaproteobacteria bacterium]MBI3389028.1 hypothetical protein [Deltaproteobacteria bacterium]
MKTRHQMLGVLIAAAGMMILSACGSDNDNEGTSVVPPTDTPVPTFTTKPTPTRTNTTAIVQHTPTPTNTLVPTATNTTGGPSNTPVNTPTVTNTPTPTASNTPVTPHEGTPTCGDGVTDAPEECDDGGTCTAGENVGAACTTVDVTTTCGAGGVCEPTGGDGCAANCTIEGAPVTVTFDPAKTRATLQTTAFALPLSLKGSQASVAGKPDADGIIPVTVKAADVKFDPVKVTGLVCACVRGKPVPAFGAGNSGKGVIGCGSQGLTNVDILYVLDHGVGLVGTDGFTEQDCADIGGRVEDGSAAHPHEGLCNAPPVITYDGSGPAGSALITTNTAIGTISDMGTCANETKTKVCSGGTNPGTACTTNAGACAGGTCIPAKGPNGIPCDSDDPVETQGTAQTLTTTTGSATGNVLHAGGLTTDGAISDDAIDADHLCGNDEPDHCVVTKIGNPYNCAALATGVTTGAANVSAFAALDAAMIGDDVVSSIFTAK